MIRFYRVHALVTAVLGVAMIVTSLITLLPGVMLGSSGKALLIAGVAVLFPAFFAALITGISAGLTRDNQGQAWRCLPSPARSLILGGIFIGVALAAWGAVGSSGDGLQADRKVGGRYYATNTEDPYRVDVEVSRAEYERLLAQDYRSMFAVVGCLAFASSAFGRMARELDPRGWARGDVDLRRMR